MAYDSEFKIWQKVVVSTVNSSVANLAASGVFTGTGESTLKVGSIQVDLKTDQNCTLTIEQSADNVNWDISDEYAYNNLIDNFGIVVQAISSYYRVIVTNLSSTTATTFLRLSSVLRPIVSTLPRSLDEDGHLKSAILGITDLNGNRVRGTQIGALRVADPYRLVGSVFGAAIDTAFWTATTSGAGSASGVALGIATIASGTANSGFGQMVSVRLARFIYGQPNSFRASIRIPTVVVALNTRRWGMFSVTGTTPQDGAYFELSAAGVLSINTVSGGVVTTVSSGSFNGKISEYILDTSVHTYEIECITEGAKFFIDGVLVHSVKPTTAVLYQTLSLPIGMTSINTAAGVTSGTLESWNSNIFRLGRDLSAPVWLHQAGANAGQLLKLGAGTLHTVTLNKLTGTSISLYDATSATNPIAIIDPSTGNALKFAIDFYTGLWMVVVGATIDITVVYE